MKQLSAKPSTKPSPHAATSLFALAAALAATLSIGCVDPASEAPGEAGGAEAADGAEAGEAAPGRSSLAEQLARDQAIDRELNLVARVVIGDERVISFHEPVPGAIAISQLGRDRVAPLELPRDPRAAFEQVAPGVAMPEVLEAAIARTQGAAGAPADLAEAVTIHVPPDRHRGAFPASDFVCWTYQRRACVYNTSFYYDFDMQDRRQRTLQLVWAVDLNVVTTHLALCYTDVCDASVAHHYYWDTFPGWWRTFETSGNFSAVLIVRRSDQFTGATNFHFSSALF